MLPHLVLKHMQAFSDYLWRGFSCQFIFKNQFVNPKLLMWDTRAIIPSWWILLIDPQKQLFCQVLQCKDFFLFLRHKCTLLWLRIVEKNQNLPRNMIRHQFDITNIVQQWESCGQLWLEMTKTQSLSTASFRSTADISCLSILSYRNSRLYGNNT